MVRPETAAIVMSRLPRVIDPREPWLRGLRAALRRIQRSGRRLLWADGTAGAEIIRRGADRIGIPCETFLTPEGTVRCVPPENSEAIPARDQWLISNAELVLVLGVRSGGNVHRALRERLADGGNVDLIDLPDLQPGPVRNDLLERGAGTWTPCQKDLVAFPASRGLELPETPPRPIVEVVPYPAPDQWVYLSHTTRACAGAWPGQDSCDYQDALLEDSADADHSSLGTLERILRQQRLIACSRMIRGGNAVVCFTEVPLSELPLLRQFRLHRVRWDFEPYGLAIHKEWLQANGCRPVVYGDEQTWDSLPESDRPFFQRVQPTTEAPAQSIDWTVEREWRLIGDLDLRAVPPGEALVFVRRYEDAVRLSSLSPWPITLWPELNTD